MEILYDEDFLEAAVRVCESGGRPGIPSLQIHRFHAERVYVYSVLDPDERSEAFHQLHLRWFRAWNLEQIVTGSLSEFPLLGRRLDVMVYRKAIRPGDEGAELYVNPAGKRHGVLGLKAERMTQNGSLDEFLLHELTHLHDMVDPEFGYSREVPLPAHAGFQEQLVRDRYRLLWDVTIEGRLAGRGHARPTAKDSLRGELKRAFSFWDEERRSNVFESLWSTPAPRHEDLMAMAVDPRALGEHPGPLPGAPCPLCGFPTFDWASFAKVHPRVVKRIRREFPGWSLKSGACSRCAEIYGSASFEVPATLFIESRGS